MQSHPRKDRTNSQEITNNKEICYVQFYYAAREITDSIENIKQKLKNKKVLTMENSKYNRARMATSPIIHK